MTILGGATGAFVGFLIPVSVNALSKKRALHRPWFHVLFGGICAYAGYKYPVYKKELLGSVSTI